MKNKKPPHRQDEGARGATWILPLDRRQVPMELKRALTGAPGLPYGYSEPLTGPFPFSTGNWTYVSRDVPEWISAARLLAFSNR